MSLPISTWASARTSSAHLFNTLALRQSSPPESAKWFSLASAETRVSAALRALIPPNAAASSPACALCVSREGGACISRAGGCPDAPQPHAALPPHVPAADAELAAVPREFVFAQVWLEARALAELADVEAAEVALGAGASAAEREAVAIASHHQRVLIAFARHELSTDPFGTNTVALGSLHAGLFSGVDAPAAWTEPPLADAQLARAYPNAIVFP